MNVRGEKSGMMMMMVVDVSVRFFSVKLRKHEFTFLIASHFEYNFPLPALPTFASFLVRRFLLQSETLDNRNRLDAFFPLRFFCWPFGGIIDFCYPSTSTPFSCCPTFAFFLFFFCHREEASRVEEKRNEIDARDESFFFCCWIGLFFVVFASTAYNRSVDSRNKSLEIVYVHVFVPVRKFSRTWDSTLTF